MSGEAQWYQNHAVQSTLWSGTDADAVAFAVVPQWSWFKQLGPQQGSRIFVRYFGNRTTQAGDVWVDALDLGPVGPPPAGEAVTEPEWERLPVIPDGPPPAAAAPAEQWY